MNADEMRTLVYGGWKEILGLPKMRKDQGKRLNRCLRRADTGKGLK